MKNTLKLTLIIALFCTTAFADGNMGGGGFAPTTTESGGVMGTGTFAPTTTESGGVMGSGGFADGNMGGGGFTDGNMGGGGKTCTGNCAINSENSVMKFIQNYLFSIFG
ncbi:MAG: hypothetical protein LUM44_06930 [Pyrinomonadaceae bacterium]|nr:hypothetical protein [Pyrinomonadaceae bacterium]